MLGLDGAGKVNTSGYNVGRTAINYVFYKLKFTDIVHFRFSVSVIILQKSCAK